MAEGREREVRGDQALTVQELLQFALTGITVGAIYAIVALSFTIVFNATGVVNFAQGEFVMLGGLFTVTFVQLHWPLALAAAAAIACAALVAWMVHTMTIGRARHSSVFSLIMVTLGIAIVVRVLAQFAFGTEPKALNTYASGISVNVLGATITLQAIWVILATVVLVAALYVFFKYTRAGQAMLACSENREAAALVGISTARISVMAFVLGGAFSALAGVLVSPITTANYNMGLLFTLKGFSAAVLGGFGSPVGAIVGGFALGILESYGAGLLSSGYQDAIALIVLVVILIVRPGGVVGSRALS